MRRRRGCDCPGLSQRCRGRFWSRASALLRRREGVCSSCQNKVTGSFPPLIHKELTHRFVVPSAFVSVLRAEQTIAMRWCARCELEPIPVSEKSSSRERERKREIPPHNVLGDLVGELADAGPAELLDDPTALRVVPAHEMSIGAVHGRVCWERVQCHLKVLFLFFFFFP